MPTFYQYLINRGTDTASTGNTIWFDETSQWPYGFNWSYAYNIKPQATKKDAENFLSAAIDHIIEEKKLNALIENPNNG